MFCVLNRVMVSLSRPKPPPSHPNSGWVPPFRALFVLFNIFPLNKTPGRVGEQGGIRELGTMILNRCISDLPLPRTLFLNVRKKTPISITLTKQCDTSYYVGRYCWVWLFMGHQGTLVRSRRIGQQNHWPNKPNNNLKPRSNGMQVDASPCNRVSYCIMNHGRS